MEIKYLRKNNLIIGLFGISLFFLVMSVLYFVIYSNIEKDFVVFMPFIVLSGLFIFLVGAILVALAISNSIKRYR